MEKLTIIMLLLLCTNAKAEWSKIEDTNTLGATIYADLGKIKNKGMSKVRMQHLINFHQKETDTFGRAYLSRKELVEYNCDEEHYRVLAFSLYTSNMGKGRVLNFSSDTKQWYPVELNTLEEALWKAACSKKHITQHD